MQNYFKELLGYTFKDINLLKLALTHSSLQKKSNERLEFLGDAFCALVCSRYLFLKSANSNEGYLSMRRSRLLEEKSMAFVAYEWSLFLYLHLSESDKRQGTAKRVSVLCNTFEALFGAIYLDAGFIEAEKIFLEKAMPFLEAFQKEQGISLKSFKNSLQEYCQKYNKALPDYRVLSSSGPPHKKKFEIGLFMENKLVERVFSKNRKQGEEKVAKLFFNRLHSKKANSFKKLDKENLFHLNE